MIKFFCKMLHIVTILLHQSKRVCKNNAEYRVTIIFRYNKIVTICNILQNNFNTFRSKVI